MRYVLGPHFGRSTSSQRILGGRQLSHLLDWLDPLWVLHRTGWKKHTIVLKIKPLSLPDVHKTQDVCELGATVLPFVRSLFCAASRAVPHHVALTRLLRTERSAWAHLKAQMRDPIGLATGSQKEVSCNSTWIHCQLRVRQQAWRQATLLAKMTKPVKVNFLSAAF